MGEPLINLSGSHLNKCAKGQEFNDVQYFWSQVIPTLGYQGEMITSSSVLLLYVAYHFIMVFISAYHIIILCFTSPTGLGTP